MASRCLVKMNRIDRLFGIMTLLQSRKFTSSEAIASRFSISIRTVYRDIRSLCDLGHPIGFEPNKGYFVVQGYFLPPISFTTEEANAFLLMETMVASFADQSISRHYSTALQKVKSVLQLSQKEKVDELQHNIRLQVPQRFQADYEYLATIQTAISKKHTLEIGYSKDGTDVTTRQVEPIGLVFYAFSWHLIGWCNLREDYRDFKVSRIVKISETAVPFRKTDHIPLSDYMAKLPVDW